MPDSLRPDLLETRLQHEAEFEDRYGSVAPPLYASSLFAFDTFDEFSAALESQCAPADRFVYSRMGNPTVAVAERKLALLEGCEACKLFASGMGAISAAVFACVSQGDHIVCVDTCYTPTRQLLNQYLPKFGVSTTFVDGRDTGQMIDAIEERTRLIYMESPGTFLFRMQDIEAVCAEARRRGISTAVDNSYASPVFQNPALLGADVVLHSASKYLGGHSDLTAGALCASQEFVERLNSNEVALFGGVLSPFGAWLIVRALRTLALRMGHHQTSANAVARALAEHPAVRTVHHAGDPDHPQRELFLRQMRGSAGLLSFELVDATRERVRDFCQRLRLFKMGVSWGGFESLAVPIQVQPMDWPGPGWIVRLYCGLEAAEDLAADVRQALARL